MKKNIYFKIGLGGLMAALLGASIYFGIHFYHSQKIQGKIAGITPSFRGARNMYIVKLNRENVSKHFFSLDDYLIKPGFEGPYAYVADLPVYLKDSDGKTKGFLSHWGYREKHGNWEMIRVGRLSEGKMTNLDSQ